ncbi:pilus assembly FimT family protein [Psychromonas hadalis]|uniref:pilus assembly FimT family protein n=1 Tax=Psychromonas hadalis TaxID=211669 RepID=UPI0003B61629|nr:prepilin-type N-terminal cleavage/methylation domain-containing protein [Psychromonas hadalis]
MRLLHKHATQGFTLIELVIVIIVLGVLSAVAIPKFSSRSGFEDYTVRDQLIARLRLVQLQGMNADPTGTDTDNACYWLVVKNSCFYNEHTAQTGGSCRDSALSASDVCITDSYNEFGRVKFPTGMLGAVNYRFDLQGKLIAGSSPISVTGDNDLSIKIESEGFIHAP